VADFSVLLPVYAGDRPAWLQEAFASITVEQELAPSEVVIVRDGPVGSNLQQTLDDLIETSAIPVTYVPLEENVRLARALDAGLKHCAYELVARADADDICRPERFKVQIPLMQDLDLLGSAVLEFSEDSAGAKYKEVRGRPETEQEIREYAPFHNPFNHPSVVYRKGAVALAGGYQDMPLMEDYWLFLRMLQCGARAANTPDVLVNYRVQESLFKRRGGWQALRSDWVFQRRIRKLGVTTLPQYVRNLTVRSIYRIVPGKLRAWGYERFVRAPYSETQP